MEKSKKSFQLIIHPLTKSVSWILHFDLYKKEELKKRMMGKKAPADDAVAPIILFSASLQLKKKSIFFLKIP